MQEALFQLQLQQAETAAKRCTGLVGSQGNALLGQDPPSPATVKNMQAARRAVMEQYDKEQQEAATHRYSAGECRQTSLLTTGTVKDNIVLAAVYASNNLLQIIREHCVPVLFTEATYCSPAGSSTLLLVISYPRQRYTPCFSTLGFRRVYRLGFHNDHSHSGLVGWSLSCKRTVHYMCWANHHLLVV